MDLAEGKSKIIELSNRLLSGKPHLLIGIAGGSGSGKSFLAKELSSHFKSTMLKMDDYYIRGICKNNKDVPRALDLALLRTHLMMLHNGKSITKPIYTFALKKDGYESIKPKTIIILDGIFALHSKFADILDIKVFVDSSEKKRLERRLNRDMEDRGYTKEHTLKRWKETVEPMYIKHILPTKQKADIIIKN